MITPSYAPHAELEKDAVTYLENHGYSVFQQTYHESLPRETVQMLQTNYSLPSLYIRSRADRIAISQDSQFEFEVKTHFNKKYNDLTLEVLPFLMHRAKTSFIDCLYVCDVNGLQFGFWASDPPKIKSVNIPAVSKNAKVKELFSHYRDEVFTGVPVYERVTSGSNDPYILISHYEISQLGDWHNIFDELKEPETERDAQERKSDSELFTDEYPF